MCFKGMIGRKGRGRGRQRGEGGKEGGRGKYSEVVLVSKEPVLS